MGRSPADAAEAIRRVAMAGAVGGSIEDFDRQSRQLYEIEHAVDRIRAAVEAAHGLAFPFTLTARAENHIRDNPDLADTIRRLRSFEEAGADVLYAPGLGTIEEIRTLCDAVSRPVNVLAVPGLSVAEIVDAGAQRISVGGSLTWVAVKAFADAAGAILDRGMSPPSPRGFRWTIGSPIDRCSRIRSRDSRHHARSMRPAAHFETRKRPQRPGTPFNSCSPASSNVNPEPAVRSLTVCETRTSEGRAVAATLAPMLTAMPPIFPSIIVHSPVCTPARTSSPSSRTRSTTSNAQRIALAGPSKVA